MQPSISVLSNANPFGSDPISEATKPLTSFYPLVQSAGAIEYTDCTSAVGYPPNEYPGYDTKQYDGEVLLMLEL